MTHNILIGVDVGSTTTKTAVLDADTHQILYSDYQRHHADQKRSVLRVLDVLQNQFKDENAYIAFTGSGAKNLSEELGVPYIQEVVANSIALKHHYQSVGTAIELGGQDAKIIFFRTDEQDGTLTVADMRMNGSCAGGTGAFIDEISAILKIPVEELDHLAGQGTCVYDISGRCGVYAKTDIQPLLNQGISKKDLALSAFHAIAKQTIGGLAQGLTIQRPVVFEGGPFTFHKTLVRVFSERLNLSQEDILHPEQPELMIARGAALSIQTMETQHEANITLSGLKHTLEERIRDPYRTDTGAGAPFFASEEEKEEFLSAHCLPILKPIDLKAGSRITGYLGIDSGSTTTKFVLMGEDEEILDHFYASNEGDPLAVARDALIDMRNRYRRSGVQLDILAAGTTGYGELLFHKAFSTECHVVETVAHANATKKYVPDATFLLDIGGQDMKAIWLDHGIITNIVVNEACSSGCGSFLENFASSLHIPVREIAQHAFSSRNPAVLGSRCTVFMNSSIVTEQRNGKLPEDIMAGLCRSIIENVFTKVIRISNLDSLGEKIVVQGGTFKNDAVLCALEQYVGKRVIRAPYPGVMGAIGAALAAKEYCQRGGGKTTFIGLDELEHLSYSQQANVPCPFCGNHCKRSVVTFSNGNSWVTNNRCERGEVSELPKTQQERQALQNTNQVRKEIPNLFRLREQLLFQAYPYTLVSDPKNTVIGIPRVLSFWDTMPFWSTFWKSLGFQVKISAPSSRTMYENGLSAVPSDTVCFPAKLVHGHIRDLAAQNVDRIFMPSIAAVASENTEKTSESMCAVVKGYPFVLRNSDNPEKLWGIAFDAPLFYWYSSEDREKQLLDYMEQTFGIAHDQTRAAIAQGDHAEATFHKKLRQAGRAALEYAQQSGTYAVVLASRPYQNDPLVNHDLPEMFIECGLPVLTVDALDDLDQIDLRHSRLDVVNNYHGRMLASAIRCANDLNLEYVQIVSFGCGHDAYLSDEIQRVMHEISGKTPLILKVDESDIQGPLRIRVRSFVETINMRRRREHSMQITPLSDPYPRKYSKRDRRDKIVLVPNTSHAFCRIMSAAFITQGIKAVPLDVGREDAIRLGKQYVHNDICFPAQIVIGEAISALKSGKYDDCKVAIGMGKYIGDCRLTHYSALLRKALDDAGFSHVPILTNDDVDYHDLHPGFKMSLLTAVRIAFALPMIDILEELLRKIRPYELVPGSAEMAFERGLDEVVFGLQKSGIRGAKKGFTQAISIMKSVAYDRTVLRPKVLIVGEYLLNFHPGANHDIEAYLERNGLEVIEARMTDVIRKTYFCQASQISEFGLKRSLCQTYWFRIANQMFEMAHDAADKIAASHPLYQPACRLPDLVRDSDPIIPHTFDAGEGVLIPGEFLHHAKHGCRAFVILQPFGCLPNHIVGRGIVKRLKELYSDAQILPLDYDPDVSFANIENRLQMLIMNIKERQTAQNKRRQLNI